MNVVLEMDPRDMATWEDLDYQAWRLQQEAESEQRMAQARAALNQGRR